MNSMDNTTQYKVQYLIRGLIHCTVGAENLDGASEEAESVIQEALEVCQQALDAARLGDVWLDVNVEPYSCDVDE